MQFEGNDAIIKGRWPMPEVAAPQGSNVQRPIVVSDRAPLSWGELRDGRESVEGGNECRRNRVAA
jgi:hypothetical protein